MTRRRLIAVVMAALALGAITAAGLPLLLAACFNLPSSRPAAIREFVMDGRAWAVYESRLPGIVNAHWTQVTRDYFTYSGPKATTTLGKIGERLGRFTPVPAEDPEVLLRDIHAMTAKDPMPISRRPVIPHPAPWGQFASGVAPAQPPGIAGRIYPCGADIGFGWPCVAAWYQITGTSVDLVVIGGPVRGGWVISGTPQPVGAANFRVLPQRPVWSGLAIDAAVFGTAWLVLFTAPAMIRRAWRRRRGLCERCGYDLRGLNPGTPCPECGPGGGAAHA